MIRKSNQYEASSKRISKRAIWIVLPLLFLFASLITHILFTARASTIGSDLYNLELAKKERMKINSELELALSQKRSLSILYTQAISEGFVPRTAVVGIDKPLTSVALGSSQ